MTLWFFSVAACVGQVEAPPEGEGEAPADGVQPGSSGGDSGGGKSDDPGGGGGDTGGTADIWSPAPGTSWQWQLSGDIDVDVDAEVFDVDLFDVSDATLTALADRGRIVVCYFSAGSYEDWREDEAQFPAEALGQPLDGWPGERWLDVRDAGVREVMRGRLDLAAARGCDAVEPDNVDGYANDSGFALTAADQLDYNRFVAQEAHARGLSVGLKNDLDQVTALVSDFDWALNEQCMQYDECDLLAPFVAAGKAVFQVEYGDSSMAQQVCPAAHDLGFDTLIKRLDLDAWRVPCES